MNRTCWKYSGLAIALLGTIGISATAQSFDTSATGTVKGAYFVRQVLTIPDASTSAIIRAVSLIGTITFDGAGNYSFTGQVNDSQSSSSTFNTTGGYAIAANGFAQLANPIHNYISPSTAGTDIEYGAVGAIGPNAIVASSTETSNGYNDLFVAIPAGSNVSNGSVTGSYRVGYLDFLQANASDVRGSFFTLTSTGGGSFGNVVVTGSIANQNDTIVTPTFSGVTYNIASANGSGTITFPTATTPLTTLISGQKTFYVSADGNIILGGAFNGFDIMVGLKGLSGSATNGTYTGTYYVAGLENPCGASPCIDSFYGATNSNGAGAAVGHLRLATFSGAPYDYTYDQTYNYGSDGTYNDGVFEYMLGAGGQAAIGVGSGGYYSLTVALKSIQYPATSVFLNPIGIVNAASFAPVTNSVAPGEYVALFGSGLAAAPVGAPSFPLQTTLGNVQVTVNGTPAPLDFVSPGQINFIMPYASSVYGGSFYSFATIQVINNGAKSNPITLYTSATAPGVLAQTANGVGPAQVTHLNGSVVTQSNPASAGETLVLYLVGLGPVSPAVADGAAAPTSTLSYAQDSAIGIDIQDMQTGAFHSATVIFAGLTPGYAGLYQVNFTMPSGTTAVPSGQAWINVNTTDAYTSEAKIFVK